MRLNATGTALVYSTFIGGNLYDKGTGVAVNSAGEAYAVGIAQAQFPTSAGSFQPNNAGSEDFFIVNINASGTGYACGGSTYVGGSDEDYTGYFYDYPAPHVSIRDNGGNNDTILVSATSHSQDFPTTPGVYGPVKVNGIADQPVFFKMSCQTNAVAPVANFNSAAVVTCNNVNINFNDSTTNNPTSWQWYFPGAVPATSNLQNPTGINYTVNGSYTISLVACNSVGCDSVSQNVQVTIPQNFSVNLGNDTTICNGSSITLSATQGFTNYVWQLNGNPVGNNLSTINASQPGIYSVLITDSSGCTGTDTMGLIVSIPVVTLGQDIIICKNDSNFITATSGLSTYQWFLNGNLIATTANTIYTSLQGSYSVLVTDSIGCTASDSLLINVSDPVVMLGADIILCNNDSQLISANAGYPGYQWSINGNSIPATTNTIYANQQGVYIVTVTDSIGCMNTDTLIATASNVSLSLMDDTTFCEGKSVTIDAGTSFAGYQWQLNGNTISTTNDVTINQTGNYFLTVSNVSGCMITDSVTIQINTLPIVQTISNATVCKGDSIALTTTGAVNYLWSPSTFLSSTIVSNPISTPGNNISYTVTGIDTNGCINSDTVSIQIEEVPEADFTYQLQFSCNGIELKTENKSLNATQYLWIFGDGNSSDEINPIHNYSTLQNQTLQLIASNGICADTLRIVNLSFQIPEFESVPNVFTPNADRINDCFQVNGIQLLSDCFSMDVYNRWGSLVYKSTSKSKCWDGKNNDGDAVTEGVYFYVISIKDEMFNGAVQLFR